MNAQTDRYAKLKLIRAKRAPEIRALAAQYKSDPEIGEIVGLSQHQVGTAREEHGIPSGRAQYRQMIERTVIQAWRRTHSYAYCASQVSFTSSGFYQLFKRLILRGQLVAFFDKNGDIEKSDEHYKTHKHLVDLLEAKLDNKSLVTCSIHAHEIHKYLEPFVRERVFKHQSDIVIARQFGMNASIIAKIRRKFSIPNAADIPKPQQKSKTIKTPAPKADDSKAYFTKYWEDKFNSYDPETKKDLLKVRAARVGANFMGTV